MSEHSVGGTQIREALGVIGGHKWIGGYWVVINQLWLHVLSCYLIYWVEYKCWDFFEEGSRLVENVLAASGKSVVSTETCILEGLIVQNGELIGFEALLQLKLFLFREHFSSVLLASP